MKLQNSVLALVLGTFGLACSARAESYYPKHVNPRVFGTDQGNVGDCQSEAEVNALENVFSNSGFSVKLSLFYRHAANWATTSHSDELKLDLNAADQAFIKQAGDLIPDYMWPEDGEGFAPARTGFRPHPSEAVAWDSTFNSGANFGFAKNLFVFQQGYTNTGTLDTLKAQIRAGKAVVLQIQSSMFQPVPNKALKWDSATGLLQEPYSLQKLTQDVRAYGKIAGKPNLTIEEELDHVVTVYGFDDSLYANQGYSAAGALIVRNSWNDDGLIEASLRELTPEQQRQVRLMRYKVSGENTPGFYAIPYQYVLDMMKVPAKNGKTGIGSYQVMELNYGLFAERYQLVQKYYDSYVLPYACDEIVVDDYRASEDTRKAVKQVAGDLATYLNTQLPATDRSQAYRRMQESVGLETQSRKVDQFPSPRFSFAKLSANRRTGVDHAADFYQGKYASYYCPADAGTATRVWPYLKHYQSYKFHRALSHLSEGGDAFSNWLEIFKSLDWIRAEEDR